MKQQLPSERSRKRSFLTESKSHLELCFPVLAMHNPGFTKGFLAHNVKIYVTCNNRYFYHMLIMHILGGLVESKLNTNPQCTLAAMMGKCL